MFHQFLSLKPTHAFHPRLLLRASKFSLFETTSKILFLSTAVHNCLYEICKSAFNRVKVENSQG